MSGNASENTYFTKKIDLLSQLEKKKRIWMPSSEEYLRGQKYFKPIPLDWILVGGQILIAIAQVSILRGQVYVHGNVF